MKEYKETYCNFSHKINSDIALYSAGIEDCPPKKFVGPRIRPYHMIHFVRCGE